MSEAAPAAAPAAPAAAPASAPAQTPGGQPGQPQRARISDMRANLERRNLERLQSPERPAPESRAPSAQPPKGAEPPQESRLLGEPEPAPEPQPGEQQQELQEPQEAPDLVEEPDQQLPPGSEAEQAASYRDIMDSAMLADELLEKRVEWVDPNGNLKRPTVKELLAGNMRQGDFQRSMNQVREREQQIAWREQQLRQREERIRDPQAMLQEYEDAGYDMVAVAKLVAARENEDKQVARAAAWAVMQQYGCDQNDARVHDAYNRTMQARLEMRQTIAQNRRLQQERDTFAQMQQQAQQHAADTERQRHLANSLAQLIPTAFRASRIHDNPANREDLLRHLNAHVRTIPNWDGYVKNSHVMAAAQLLAEELEDRRARKREAPAQPPPRKPLVSGKIAPRGAAAPQQAPRKRISDMRSDERLTLNR